MLYESPRTSRTRRKQTKLSLTKKRKPRSKIAKFVPRDGSADVAAASAAAAAAASTPITTAATATAAAATETTSASDSDTAADANAADANASLLGMSMSLNFSGLDSGESAGNESNESSADAANQELNDALDMSLSDIDALEASLQRLDLNYPESEGTRPSPVKGSSSPQRDLDIDDALAQAEEALAQLGAEKGEARVSTPNPSPTKKKKPAKTPVSGGKDASKATRRLLRKQKKRKEKEKVRAQSSLEALLEDAAQETSDQGSADEKVAEKQVLSADDDGASLATWQARSASPQNSDDGADETITDMLLSNVGHLVADAEATMAEELAEDLDGDQFADGTEFVFDGANAAEADDDDWDDLDKEWGEFEEQPTEASTEHISGEDTATAPSPGGSEGMPRNSEVRIKVDKLVQDLAQVEAKLKELEEEDALEEDQPQKAAQPMRAGPAQPSPTQTSPTQTTPVQPPAVPRTVPMRVSIPTSFGGGHCPCELLRTQTVRDLKRKAFLEVQRRWRATERKEEDLNPKDFYLSAKKPTAADDWTVVALEEKMTIGDLLPATPRSEGKAPYHKMYLLYAPNIMGFFQTWPQHLSPSQPSRHLSPATASPPQHISPTSGTSTGPRQSPSPSPPPSPALSPSALRSPSAASPMHPKAIVFHSKKPGGGGGLLRNLDRQMDSWVDDQKRRVEEMRRNHRARRNGPVAATTPAAAEANLVRIVQPQARRERVVSTSETSGADTEVEEGEMDHIAPLRPRFDAAGLAQLWAMEESDLDLSEGLSDYASDGFASDYNTSDSESSYVPRRRNPTRRSPARERAPPPQTPDEASKRLTQSLSVLESKMQRMLSDADTMQARSVGASRRDRSKPVEGVVLVTKPKSLADKLEMAIQQRDQKDRAQRREQRSKKRREREAMHRKERIQARLQAVERLKRNIRLVEKRMLTLDVPAPVGRGGVVVPGHGVLGAGELGLGPLLSRRDVRKVGFWFVCGSGEALLTLLLVVALV